MNDNLVMKYLPLDPTETIRTRYKTLQISSGMITHRTATNQLYHVYCSHQNVVPLRLFLKHIYDNNVQT